MSHGDEELIDYEDENDVVTNSVGVSAAATRAGDDGDKGKKDFSGIHSTGFRYIACTHFGFSFSHNFPGISS